MAAPIQHHDYPTPSVMPAKLTVNGGPQNRQVRRIAVPDAETLQNSIESIHDVLDRLTARTCKIEDVQDELKAWHTSIETRVAQLEPKPKDDFNDQILTFMKSLSPMKMTVGVIVENMPNVTLDDYSKVYNRVISLVNSGHLKGAATGEGKNRMYWAEVDPS